MLKSQDRSIREIEFQNGEYKMESKVNIFKLLNLDKKQNSIKQLHFSNKSGQPNLLSNLNN